MNLNPTGVRLCLLVLALGLALSGLASCQKKAGAIEASSPPAAPAQQNITKTLDLRSLESLQLPPLECGSSKACPKGVGELVTVTEAGLKFCTVSLVDDDMILTAHHCIPWESVTSEGKIKGNCWVRWAVAVRGTAAVSECSEVVKASVQDDQKRVHGQDDFAFMALKSPQTGRRPFDLHDIRVGPKSNRVILFGVHLDKTKHVLQRLACQSDEKTTLPDLDVNNAKLIIMPSCPIEAGFSGGPIFEPNNRGIMGVISFRKDPVQPEDAKSIIAVGSKI